MNSTDTLILNFTDEGLKPSIAVTQYDSGRKVTCCIAGVTGEISLASVYCKKPSGLEVYKDAEIINGNTIEFEIDPQMTTETGVADCQLQLTGEDKTLTSFVFSISVSKNLLSESRVTSSDNYPALQALLEELSGLVQTEISEQEIDALAGVQEE